MSEMLLLVRRRVTTGDERALKQQCRHDVMYNVHAIGQFERRMLLHS